jgi:hypothetical protein
MVSNNTTIIAVDNTLRHSTGKDCPIITLFVVVWVLYGFSSFPRITGFSEIGAQIPLE